MAYHKLLLALLLVVCSQALSLPKSKVQLTNNRPIIGIVAQKIGEGLPHYADRDYIAASYVKYIESAGGRVVPIFTNHSDDGLRRLFNSINGVVLPGGSAAMLKSGYYKTAKRLFEMSQKANDVGDHFPIWATCLGFETLHVLRMDGDTSVLSNCHAKDYSWSLNFTASAFKSKLFSTAPPQILKILQEGQVAYNHHSMCARPEQYEKHQRLRDFFSVLSTNRDADGMQFVSTIEAINYPFYGVQWHPEKNPYEWTTSEKINHSPDAIAATQYVANFFLAEARKNGHKFANVVDETKSLIYNFCPKMTVGITHFEEFYIF